MSRAMIEIRHSRNHVISERVCIIQKKLYLVSRKTTLHLKLKHTSVETDASFFRIHSYLRSIYLFCCYLLIRSEKNLESRKSKTLGHSKHELSVETSSDTKVAFTLIFDIFLPFYYNIVRIKEKSHHKCPLFSRYSSSRKCPHKLDTNQ